MYPPTRICYENRTIKYGCEGFKSLTLNELNDEMENEILDPKLMAIIRVLESLSGKKIDTSFLKKTDLHVSSSDAIKPKLLDWGMEYNYERHEIHDESLKFAAEGNVKSEDGKSIDFSLAFSMKNYSEIHEKVSLKAGDALIDPLVINFDTDTVTISDIKHNFDLNLDGKNDEFSFVGKGSGFLALDKNNDGIINDGSELFGPDKGNGFDELRVYDTDNNNWIDENDDIFNSLVIWTKHELGEENFYSLKDKNVGALYLGQINTQFDLNYNKGDKQALLKESSIFLKEDGGISTIQEIDLVI